VRERGGFVLLYIGMYGGEGDARVVADDHEKRLSACPID